MRTARRRRLKRPVLRIRWLTVHPDYATSLRAGDVVQIRPGFNFKLLDGGVCELRAVQWRV